MVTEYSSIRIVNPSAFDLGTAQTPGSVRLAAIAPQLGVHSALWGGLFEVKPGARTGIHHHGEQQTIAYVLCTHPVKTAGGWEAGQAAAATVFCGFQFQGRSSPMRLAG